MTEVYKFQKLRVYQMALDYVDAVYELSRKLPEYEKYSVRDKGHQLFIKLQAFRKSLQR